MRHSPKFSVVFAALTLFVAMFLIEARADQMTIAAVVNERAISHSDVEDRFKLVRESARLPDNEEIRKRLIPQIIDNLIEEQIKMQEAERIGVKASEEEIEQGFQMIAKQNNIEATQFKSMLSSRNINLQTLRSQIESQIVWGKVVQAQLRPQITVTSADVDVVLERFKRNIGKDEYLTSEIVLPFDQGASQAELSQLADRLVRQMKEEKVPFHRVASQFSKSAGAAQGGNLGWVQEDQFTENLAKAIKTLDKGEISDPIKTLTGYHILLVRNKRTISEDTIPSVEDITNSIGQERLERLQRQYLMDLKGAAFIESRV